MRRAGGCDRSAIEQPGQRGAAEIGHAQRAQAAGRVVLDGVERDDVGVLQARQRQVLAGLAGRELEDDRPVAQRKLAGQEDPALRSAAELGQEQEVAQRFAGRGKLRRDAARAQEALAVEQHLQLRPPLREAAEHLLDRHFRTVLLAEAEFLVDEIGGRLGVLPEFRVACEKILRQRSLALPPAAGSFPRPAAPPAIPPPRGQRCWRSLIRGTCRHENGLREESGRGDEQYTVPSTECWLLNRCVLSTR